MAAWPAAAQLLCEPRRENRRAAGRRGSNPVRGRGALADRAHRRLRIGPLVSADQQQRIGQGTGAPA